MRQSGEEPSQERHFLGLNELRLHTGELTEADALDLRFFFRLLDAKAQLKILETRSTVRVEHRVFQPVELFVVRQRFFEVTLRLVQARHRFVEVAFGVPRKRALDET